ncbi:MAG: HlyD family efflux transporter periplasmic adaptor subunit [Hyphomicrobiaceae bacterium]
MPKSSARSTYPLPELRQELRLHEGPRDDGHRTWIIYDPLRHRYFQISRQAFEILTLWRSSPVSEFAVEARQVLGWPVDVQNVEEIAKFILANNLAVDPPGGDAKVYSLQVQRARHGGLSLKLLHNYLFFKIPLVHPARVLAAMMPFAAPLFTRTTAIIIAILGICGLYLSSRQWESFVSTFVDYLNLEGAILFACVLVFVKTLHELGHAFVATRAGVRVTSMGIAVMLMTPMLYTDVSDAWRLRDRRSKLAIDAAGIAVELALAALALFLWAFLADGPLRSTAFMIATTSLFMGLAINLNPLMKFDGYHMLADSWGISNLQQRSNALAIWRLRELLFGLGHEPPGTFLPQKQTLLILYAVAAWLYRMVLFLGIALVVYHAFFKVLGIILFAVEILWFILLPAVREIRAWWDMRNDIAGQRRSLITGAVTIVCLTGLFVPWSSTISAQGMAIASYQFRFYAPRPARVETVEIKDGQSVAAGAVAFTLSSPDLEREAAQAQKRITSSEVRLDRIAGDEADRANRLVLEGELARDRSNLDGLQRELDRLVVKVPTAGLIKELDLDLRPGEWINDAKPLARLVGQGAPQVVTYIAEQDVHRLVPGALATFIQDDPLQPMLDGRVIEIAPAGARALEYVQLASVFGGSIPSDREPNGEVRPRSGCHLVRIALYGQPLKQAQRGIIRLVAERESIATAISRRILQVLIRESGT